MSDLRNAVRNDYEAARTQVESSVNYGQLATYVAGGIGLFLVLVVIGALTRRMTDSLISVQQRFERASDGAAEGLWDYEPSTGAVWYSSRFKELCGLTPDQFDSFEHVIESWSNLLHPEDKEPTLARVEAHLTDNTPYDVNHRLRMPTGEYRWFRARGASVRDEAGTVLQMSGSIMDIHAERIAQTRLDLATRAAGIGLWDWDVPSGKTFFSDTFYTMLGYKPGELPMSLDTWKSLVHPDDLESAMADVSAHLEGKTTRYVNEHRLRTKSGEWCWIRDVGEVVEWALDGSPRRVIGIHVDIQTLQEAKDAAEDANLAKSDFLANMSHEIRTPMTAVLGYLDVLEEAQERSDSLQSAEAIWTIRRNAAHLLTVINDILDFSKIEAGKVEIEWLEAEPLELSHDVVAILSSQARSKGLELTITFDSRIPRTIRTDPTRLRQILINIVGNAIKFTDDGSVTIHVSCRPSEKILEFCVVDTGVGMTPAQCRQIQKFEAFTQADSSTTRVFGGSGLGLRISHSMAQALGGHIEIESEFQKGTTVRVTVSTGDLTGVEMVAIGNATGVSPAPARTSKKPRTAVRSLAGLRILVADDAPDNRRLISFYLRKAGADVAVVENGRLAVLHVLNQPDDTPTDIVLMDIQMPVLDGYGATRELRESGVTLPIIAVTANSMTDDQAVCSESGCDDYLPKPIDLSLLLEKCARWGGLVDADGPTVEAVGELDAIRISQEPGSNRPHPG